ncbi:MAG: hypothetical protein CL915_06590 [Deltaproteobacteria bacterium]|jgi:hypothetical protein|nr:hypothetical protein [Deltaproteobacteria bacterium]
MNKTDSTNILNSDVLLQEKERTITIQQSCIDRLEKRIEHLEQDKKIDSEKRTGIHQQTRQMGESKNLSPLDS